jgi:hypothetical protein
MRGQIGPWQNLRQIEASVRAAIPIGSPLALADDYFKQNRVPHSLSAKDKFMYASVGGIRQITVTVH